MQYTFNVISSVFNARPQLQEQNPASTTASLQPVTVGTTPHCATQPMTAPNNNNYLQDSQPFSLFQTVQDTFAVFNMLRTMGPAIGAWQQGNQTVIALAQRNNHHIISQNGSVENLIAPPPTPPSPTHLLGWAYHLCSQVLRYGTNYLYHHALPPQVSAYLIHQAPLKKVEQTDRENLLHHVIQLYQTGKLGSIQGFNTRSMPYFGDIEQQRLSLVIENASTSVSTSKTKLLQDLKSVTGSIQQLYQAEKDKVEPAVQQWQQLFSQLNQATQKVLSKDVDCQEAIGREGVTWLQNALGLLNETPIGQLFFSMLFQQPSDQSLSIDRISQPLPLVAKESLNRLKRENTGISPIDEKTTLAELSDRIAHCSQKMAQCVHNLTKNTYTPNTKIESILSFMLEATQKEGDPKTLFLQTQKEILTTEQNHIETTRELPAFLAIPLVLSDFTAEGKSGRRIFKEILRQNLPYLKSTHHAPETTPPEQSNSTKSDIRFAPLRAIKKIFAFLNLKKESTPTPQILETQRDSQYPAQITPAAQGLSAKESPEMRFLHSLRKDFDQAICSGNLWKGIIDATRMTEKSRQHLLQVVQSLAITEGEKQNFHQLIQSNHLPSIIAWIEKMAASTPAISNSTQQYIQSVLYRSSEAHTMQMLVQIAHIAERERRAPHATEQQKMQALCDQLIETRTLLLGLDPTNLQLKKAQDPNFWRINLKAKAQTIAEHYPKDTRYTTLTDDATLEWLNNIFSQGIAYHQYSIEGMHHIPKEGRCLIAFNHTLATYEIALFGDAMARDHGRLLRMLVHDNFFKYSDYVAKKSAAIGFIPAKKDTTVRLLENEQIVGVCPGGIKEALKPSNHHKDDVMWENTKGFARISLLTGAPVVLAACPAANDLYSIKQSALTNTVVNKLALPAPVFTSDTFPKPNPVKLTHHLSPAVYPPALPENLARAIDKQSATPEKTHPEFKALLDQYHHQLWSQMQALMQEARVKDQAKQAF